MQPRRNSHSANMLKPTVAVFQGQQQEQFDSRDIRRSSEPNVPPGMINGGFPARQQSSQAHVAQAQNVKCVAPQLTNNFMQGQHQQQQAVANNRYRSFASSMDLISPTAFPARGSGSTMFQPPQSNLFKSSSHHTAATGDLLTMSRRSLDPPQPTKSNTTTKKRSSTMSDGIVSNTSHHFNFTSFNGSSSQPMAGQYHQGNPQHAPQQRHSTEGVGGFLPVTQDKSGFSHQTPLAYQDAASVSSSTLGTAEDKYESYQHRAKQRCRRSDSFEMMEDG